MCQLSCRLQRTEKVENYDVCKSPQFAFLECFLHVTMTKIT